jgi:hypothetical protein
MASAPAPIKPNIPELKLSFAAAPESGVAAADALVLDVLIVAEVAEVVVVTLVISPVAVEVEVDVEI